MEPEANIPPAFPISSPPPVVALRPEAWLAALRNDAVRVEVGRAIPGPVDAGWTTLPRTPENPYTTHYLFHAPAAGLAVRLPGRTLPGPPGTLAWFPPGAPYSVGLLESPRRAVLLRLRFVVRRDRTHLTPWREATLIRGMQGMTGLVETLATELAVPDTFSDDRCRAFLAGLSVEAFRCREEEAPDAPRLTRRQARQVIDYADAHAADRPAPADLAAVVRLSPAYFARVFRRTFGVSPRRWLVARRVEHGARLLLDTPLNVSEVAYRLGYDEPRVFTRQFRACLGLTPTAYRRTH
ncbi:MAG: helix-turn-helix domain-containing protein [Planctomycetota bacterium]